MCVRVGKMIQKSSLCEWWVRIRSAGKTGTFPGEFPAQQAPVGRKILFAKFCGIKIECIEAHRLSSG